MEHCTAKHMPSKPHHTVGTNLKCYGMFNNSFCSSFMMQW